MRTTCGLISRVSFTTDPDRYHFISVVRTCVLCYVILARYVVADKTTCCLRFQYKWQQWQRNNGVSLPSEIVQHLKAHRISDVASPHRQRNQSINCTWHLVLGVYLLCRIHVLQRYEMFTRCDKREMLLILAVRISPASEVFIFNMNRRAILIDIF